MSRDNNRIVILLPGGPPERTRWDDVRRRPIRERGERTMVFVRVRRLTPDDIDLLRDVRLRTLRDTPDAFWTTHETETAYSAGDWRRWLSTAALFVAVQTDRDQLAEWIAVQTLSEVAASPCDSAV